MRNVKCQICGKLLEQDKAYQVKFGDINKYYCSEEEYLTDKIAKETKKALLSKIVEVYQYCTEYAEPPYTIVTKELNGDLSTIPIETLAQFVEENRERLRATIIKKIARDGQFNSFYNEVRYISTIIKREILDNDWKSKQTKPNSMPKKPGDISIYKPKHVEYIPVRRPLSELVEDKEDND